jgi:hypothetical protein
LGGGRIDPGKVNGGVTVRSIQGAFAKAGGDAGSIQQVQEVEGGPGLKVMGPAGSWEAWGGPGRGVGVKVTDVQSRCERVQLQVEKAVATGWVLDVVVDIGYEEVVVACNNF